jgi:sugar lactone lactonase YvrE
MKIAVDCVVRGSDELGECTVWDDEKALLWWVDIRGPALKSYNPANGVVHALALSEFIGSFGLTSAGGMVAGMKSGLYLLDPHSGALDLLAAPEKHLPANRFNDGRCDRAGRFWAGTMTDGKREPVGSLYRLEPDGICVKVRSGITVPNSICWSPDDATMYFADTHLGMLWAYDFDCERGTMRNERVFADCSNRPGRPDGSCVDAEGCLWNAEYGGGRVVRYRPDGKIDQAIELPVSNVTCCCFGGADLSTLYISTARQRMSAEQLAREPLAGALFACRPGARGLPEARFKAPRGSKT